MTDNTRPKEPSVPPGYSELPNGERCNCPRLWTAGVRLYCCGQRSSPRGAAEQLLARLRNPGDLHGSWLETMRDAADLIEGLAARVEKAESALRNQSPEPSSSEVRLKPLEWSNGCASTPIGDYLVVEEDWDEEPFWFIIFNGKPLNKLGEHKDEASAIAAAQADYERRIRAALSAPTPAAPADGLVEPVAWCDTLDSCLETFWCLTEAGSDNRLLADGAIDAARHIRTALSSAEARIKELEAGLWVLDPAADCLEGAALNSKEGQ